MVAIILSIRNKKRHIRQKDGLLFPLRQRITIITVGFFLLGKKHIIYSIIREDVG